MSEAIQLNQWQVFVSDPSQLATLDEFNDSAENLISCQLDSLGCFTHLFENTPFDSYINHLNFYDWWLVCEFPDPTYGSGKECLVDFPPIATFAEAWMNDQKILESESMFYSNQVICRDFLKNNRLVICIRALSRHLEQKRSRPRWKTKLVKQQGLRWIRTSLLGHIPAWSPDDSVVGVLGSVNLRPNNYLKSKCISTHIVDSKGVIELTADIISHQKLLRLQLDVNECLYDLDFSQSDDLVRINNKVEVDNIEYWWPHTHGTPHCYKLTLLLTTDGGEIKLDLAEVGFRQIEIDRTDGNFEFVINGKHIFSRGVCWTVASTKTWHQDESTILEQLIALKQLGANMIRVVGTADYQSDFFYQTCSRMGILVWQDLMFANMDYPTDDNMFETLASREVRYQAQRISAYPCLALICGNSEVEQQARMLGFSAEEASNPFFDEVIPKLLRQVNPKINYLPSTPSGGAMPFHLNAGPSHYYGIGAYQRSLLELRRHDVRFAAETLGFSNPPVAATLAEMFNGDVPVVHDPRWKLGTPRDPGTGWDFDDIRDFYFQQLFDCDPSTVRYTDPELYLALSTVTSGEVMSQVFDEWRRRDSRNSGGLIWFYKDLKPGAGWGLIDSNDQKKAAYYYLKRVWQPINVSVTDELFQGLCINLVNDSNYSFNGQLTIIALNEFNNPVIDHEIEIEINPNDQKTVNVEEVLGRFFDICNVYRFGPKKVHVFSAILTSSGQEVNAAFYFPNSIPLVLGAPELSYQLIKKSEDTLELSIQSTGFIYAVEALISGFEANDNYFNLLPNRPKVVQFNRVSDVSRIKGHLSAVGLNDSLRLKLSNK